MARIRLWSTGKWSVFAPAAPVTALDEASTSSQPMATIPETDEVAPVPVVEADGQFKRIWNVTDPEQSRGVFTEIAAFEVLPESQGAQGSLQAYTVQLPLAVSVAKITFVLRDDNVGDSLYMDVAAGTIVGKLTEPANQGDTSVALSGAAADAFFSGCDLSIGESRYTVTGVAADAVNVWPAIKEAAEDDKEVAFSIPVVKNYLVTKPGDYAVEVGGRYLPQSCPITIVYTNRSEAKKQCLLIVEYRT